MEKKNKCVCVPTANDYMYQHAPRLSVLADQRCKCCTTDEEQHRHTGLACSVSWSYLFIFFRQLSCECPNTLNLNYQPFVWGLFRSQRV